MWLLDCPRMKETASLILQYLSETTGLPEEDIDDMLGGIDMLVLRVHGLSSDRKNHVDQNNEHIRAARRTMERLSTQMEELDRRGMFGPTRTGSNDDDPDLRRELTEALSRADSYLNYLTEWRTRNWPKYGKKPENAIIAEAVAWVFVAARIPLTTSYDPAGEPTAAFGRAVRNVMQMLGFNDASQRWRRAAEAAVNAMEELEQRNRSWPMTTIGAGEDPDGGHWL